MIVVKLGGADGIDVDAVVRDLAGLGEPWVLVHGGNAELDHVSRALGCEPRFVTSPSGHTSRVTDRETMRAMQMVYRGRRNNEIVRQLQALGVDAVGLSGVDGRLWQAERKTAVRYVENGRKFLLRDDYTGKVVRVNADLVQLLLAAGYVPVMTLPAITADGEAVNVDGDRAAAAVAVALRAEALLLLSNVPGLLCDLSDPETLVPRVKRHELGDVSGLAGGRMKKKLLAAGEALDGGVPRVVLATADSKSPVRDALAGVGTVIRC